MIFALGEIGYWREEDAMYEPSDPDNQFCLSEGRGRGGFREQSYSYSPSHQSQPTTEDNRCYILFVPESCVPYPPHGSNQGTYSYGASYALHDLTRLFPPQYGFVQDNVDNLNGTHRSRLTSDGAST